LVPARSRPGRRRGAVQPRDHVRERQGRPAGLRAGAHLVQPRGLTNGRWAPAARCRRSRPSCKPDEPHPDCRRPTPRPRVGRRASAV
ncbi:uncharacterized protein METZ01_LOCUS288877, partial [marine metagenome]